MTDEKWHHYAVTVANNEDNLKTVFYIDGIRNNTVVKESVNIGRVTGNMSGTIGVLATHDPQNVNYSPPTSTHRWGAMTGSLDDIRFWKTERNAREIGTYYDKPVYGATEEDVSRDPKLGLYYKFNEGITQNSNLDETVLDYSGRLNNGVIENYISEYIRNTGSAINESSTPNEEPLDAILYLNDHSKVTSALSSYVNLGRSYDLKNHTALAKSVPQWAYDSNGYGSSTRSSDFAILLQAMASEFDNIKMYIDNILRIKSTEITDYTNVTTTDYVSDNDLYLFGCSSEFGDSHAGIGDNSQLVEWNLKARDFDINSVYSPSGDWRLSQGDYDPTVNESLLEMSEPASTPINFSQKTHEVKNKILKNVYKNLVHLYKSKGTENSFRNLIRCYGVDENLIKLNVYAKNEEREILNEPITAAIKKKSVSFQGENQNATLHQTASLYDSDAKSYIPATTDITPWSVESSFVFF